MALCKSGYTFAIAPCLMRRLSVFRTRCLLFFVSTSCVILLSTTVQVALRIGSISAGYTVPGKYYKYRCNRGLRVDLHKYSFR